MAIPKRRAQADHDSPAAKKLKTNTTFAIGDFVEIFLEEVPLPSDDDPIVIDNDTPLPSTVLTNNELQDGTLRKPPRRSVFNTKLPVQLNHEDDASAQNAPFDWMKNQYAHCVVPELGEEYDFAFDSPTFYCLRDLHNARVRIRDGEYLPDYMVCSLATRWVSLEEKSRPASDGYLANGDVFVATCLPITYVDDDLERYFETKYSEELSAQYYIPRSRYSVHFVGQPNLTENDEIQTVTVGSVLIRNTKTGDVIHIDTGALTSRKARARDAGRVLKAWLEFQQTKSPEADLGPISNSAPYVLDVDKETDPNLRSYHALVSASLFLRRRITNWGDVKAFQQRSNPASAALANYALQNISGWLGIRTPARPAPVRPKNSIKTKTSFEENYIIGALFGRQTPAPISRRIASAEKGGPPVYNEDTEVDDEASAHKKSRTDSSVLSAHNGVDSDQDTLVVDESSNSEEALDDEASHTEVSNDKEPVTEKSVPQKEPNDKELSQEEHNSEELNLEEANSKEPIGKEPNSKTPNDKEPSDEEPNDEAPNDEAPNDKEPNDTELNGDNPSHEDLNSEQSSSHSESDGGEGDDQIPAVSA